MSASLVGSEMCIRDSLKALEAAAYKRIEMLTNALRRFRRDSSFWPLVPVSYTHLTLPTICSV
eukprot:6476137-Alexandrium_andersonii.AAC.1